MIYYGLMKNFCILLEKFLKIHTLLICVGFTNALATELDASISTRLRYDEGEDIRQQYAAQFKFKHEFGEDSCISVNAHLQSGLRYGSNSVDYDRGLNLNLRKVYLDIQCIVDKTININENADIESIQIGAIPVESLNSLDLEKNSWIDGAKVVVDLKTIIDKFTLTYGSVNPDASPDVFERFNEERVRFVRATIEKEITEQMKTQLALTDYNDEIIFQAVLEVATDDFLPFADEIQIFTARSEEKTYHNGIVLEKQIGDYNLKYGYYDIDEELYDVSSFIGDEDAFFISLSKEVLERLTFTIRYRKGKTEQRVDMIGKYIF